MSGSFLEIREDACSLRARAIRARYYVTSVLKHHPDAVARVPDYARELEELAAEIENLERRATAFC